ncbi:MULTISPECIES: TetR/AcrR family transcriptional regulator [unclassified Pseudonocardia]|uniref:TetR/AcrR family transcriptional regulator n=1 Tax=unclassified Pseudonocardia TaxID=2619320 RepID=UPI000761E28C|nr:MULTISPECIES: TetR/AcrR family transcriptional regulator [unclassified Pseudonocardia]OLL86079.1 Transcriptional regulator, TetR family [Pseudonocardia sp. Ae263_Ps1]OLM20406.1 Transcriptional regulator, TetR family [Pseudonocardia sp. Ae707_Ps1]
MSVAEQVTGDRARMGRVLDAAADLLVRRGYRRVTIEDVARQAGVGKGTVYLHVRTKDALFLTVLLRSQHRLFGEMADRMPDEPELVLPWRMTRLIHELVQSDEVTRALYLGDAEVLGRLAHEAAGTLGELARRREDAVREHLGLLREAGLVGTDLSIGEQIRSWGAIAYGFLATTGLPVPGGDPSAPGDAARQGVLAEHAVGALLAGPAARAGEPVPPDVAARVAGVYHPLVAHVDQEWRSRVR